MAPLYHVENADCLEAMPKIDADSIDSIVTDPPYGLSFMGKDWDHGIPGVPFWAEALRVAKPGAHLLAFGGTRTFHRLAVAIEDAGWEIRDCVMWVYGSGFPKSHNLKGEREGWGTALKPAWEPIIVARKPLVGTVAANVEKFGTGAINIDGCRVGENPGYKYNADKNGTTFHGDQGNRIKQTAEKKGQEFIESSGGRWPANLIHDGSEEVTGLMPDVNGVVGAKREGGDPSIFSGGGHKQSAKQKIVGGTKDTGSAARFFYCAKTSKKDRDEGCEGLPQRVISTWGGDEDDLSEGKKSTIPKGNTHPTVKPTDLMRYLCRLVTPPNGVVLDPFCGSGSTGKAAILEGFNFVGVEMQAEYAEIAWKRIEAAAKKFDLTGQPT